MCVGGGGGSPKEGKGIYIVGVKKEWGGGGSPKEGGYIYGVRGGGARYLRYPKAREGA